MTTGLLAVLDDVSALVKTSAASLDDLAESLARIPVLGWLIKVIISGLGGLIIGAIIAQVVTLVRKVF